MTPTTIKRLIRSFRFRLLLSLSIKNSYIDLITSLSEKYMSKEDLMIDYQLDAKKQNNYNVIRKNANDSIVALIEGKINCLDVRKRT